MINGQLLAVSRWCVMGAERKAQRDGCWPHGLLLDRPQTPAWLLRIGPYFVYESISIPPIFLCPDNTLKGTGKKRVEPKKKTAA